ncbi:MAG: YitT family protein [Bacteroidetes bacterium]|nr:YitT family protein [Bacteroidota bacterium]
MAFVTNEKLFSKQWFIAYSLIVLGSFILAAGFVFFINPYNIVPGGVYGIGIVIHHLVPKIPIGLFGLAMNIPLTVLGIRILGPRFGIKTVIGMILASVFMDMLTFLIGDESPKTMLNGSIDLSNDVLLACVFGGVLIGFGLGLIFKAKATSGGSDIVAMIIAKYTRLPLGQLMIYVDSMIVLLGLIVFRDWKIPLYSWIVIFITGKVIDVVLEGVSYDKTLFIISDKYEEIRDKILTDLNRGGTFINGNGMFNNSEKKIIFTVVNRRELAILQEFIHQIDPNAFLTVIDANEILGKGFKSLEEKVTT